MNRWRPLKRVDDQPNYQRNPSLIALRRRHGLKESDDEVWASDEYQCLVRYLEPTAHGEELEVPRGREGMMQLSIHRMDRRPIGNWRIMQQIKNEVAGPDREAIEIYPAESRLVDTSNEYHLWVMPIGGTLPMGFSTGAVTSDKQVEEINDTADAGWHKGRQEPWMPGMTTGRNPEAPVLSEEDAEVFRAHFQPDDMDGPDGLGG